MDTFCWWTPLLTVVVDSCFQTSLFGAPTTSTSTGLFGAQPTGFGQAQTGTALFGQSGFGQPQQQVGNQLCFGMGSK